VDLVAGDLASGKSPIALGSIVEWDTLVETVAVSIGAGVGLAIAFSLAVYGAARFAEARRADAPVAAGGAAALAIVSLLVCFGAIVGGILVLTSG
jgi:hypothetical protein